MGWQLASWFPRCDLGEWTTAGVMLWKKPMFSAPGLVFPTQGFSPSPCLGASSLEHAE